MGHIRADTERPGTYADDPYYTVDGEQRSSDMEYPASECTCEYGGFSFFSKGLEVSAHLVF